MKSIDLYRPNAPAKLYNRDARVMQFGDPIHLLWKAQALHDCFMDLKSIKRIEFLSKEVNSIIKSTKIYK
ncbi:hypothetical protein OUZ56_002933 [Daphnia magna]|uniref:Uncharacterized protein n=1 Tax=Daphnia magna TaxID=35525 RepID=A0ABR0A7J8_9CRUS|nr:hypothetical protein OUZ56_002933 [Daphnia magna]